MQEDDIYQLEQQPLQVTHSTEADPRDNEDCYLAVASSTEEWMLICQFNVETTISVTTCATADSWCSAVATFITHQWEAAIDDQPFVSAADPK